MIGSLFHQGPDVFEAHRRFVDFHAQHLGHGIDLVTRGDAAHDRAGPAAVLLQMIERQRQHLVGRQPRAVLVHNAEAVGIAIQAQADLRLAAADELADFAPCPSALGSG